MSTVARPIILAHRYGFRNRILVSPTAPAMKFVHAFLVVWGSLYSLVSLPMMLGCTAYAASNEYHMVKCDAVKTVLYSSV